MQGAQELTHEARAEGKSIYAMPCKKEENIVKPTPQHTWRTATRKCEEKLYKKRFYKAQEKSHCAAY